MGKEWNYIKNDLKKTIIMGSKRIISVILIIVMIVILLAASIYFITIDDGTYKEGDWSSVNYGAGVYVNSVKVNDDGTLSSDMTIQELWDKLVENDSPIVHYLDKPEELARMMKAEIVTQYPDTRKNPDEEIDWKEIVENEDSLQGIIKFKRADTNGNKSTMTYVDPDTFQGYIDEYNNSGNETAKKNALSHFTLKKASASTATGNGATAVAAGEGVMTDVSQAIIDAINRTPWPGASLCLKWVDDVYENAGVTPKRQSSAYQSYLVNGISSDRTAIPVGAAVYGTGTGTAGGPYGHVGIYIGGGKVVDSVGTGIKTSTLDEWIGWQERYARNGNNVLTDLNGNQQHGWLGWGWADGNRIRGTTQDPNVTQNDSAHENTDEDKKSTETAVVKNVSGDGYSQEYISSAGITYKHYKQYEGSYAENSYWDGTIHSSGCGPTSIAILASGLTNSNYTPGDIAANMSYTSYETLKQEMEVLGMSAEVIQNPSAETIQDNLKNGKVMLVSVNNNTIFTNNSHIMALVDINSSGQVYICNPGSGSLYGWYDVEEIMKGCQYIVVTDAGAAGIANSTNSSNYVAVVATWTQLDTIITTTDPEVEPSSTTQYSMTTTNINYEEMVDPYTVPFDLLWAFLVIGEDKNFIFDFTDLIYGSDIQITIHDNLTVNTDIDDWNYTQRTKAVLDGTITASFGHESATKRINNHIHEDDELYNTVKTVITQTNTINVALTKANVWVVDYTNEYTYVEPSTTSDTNVVTQPDQEYPSEPNRTGDSLDSRFNCEHIGIWKEELKAEIADKLPEGLNRGESQGSSPSYITPTYIENYEVKYFDKYINITDTITNEIKTQKYTQGVPDMKEKTDEDADEPNFVTIFNKPQNKKNKKYIKSVPDWLFEIIETNDSTKDMLDMIKYLLYKATGTNYGVVKFDFNAFFARNLTTVGAGDYIVNIDMSSSDIVITDLNTLKQAFSGYSGSEQLQRYASDFLEYQEKYRVNAVFAAAVSISETSAGRAGHAVNGKNNWFNIECTCGNSSHGRFETYSSANKSIERFFWQISQGSYYFTAGNYTVSSIGMIYCENADAPGGWIENTTTYMTEMFNAAGISVSLENSTEKGKAIVEAAKSKLGCSYVWGAEGPNTFDCSGLTRWCYKQVGIDIPHNSESQKNSALKKVTISEARVGDILYKQGHVAIYIGNGQCIEAPHTGAVVKISNNINRFVYALQFY